MCEALRPARLRDETRTSVSAWFRTAVKPPSEAFVPEIDAGLRAPLGLRAGRLFQVGREPDFVVAERLRDHFRDAHRPGGIEVRVVVAEELAGRPGG